MDKRKKTAGFSLLELIAVIVILGILSVLGFSKFMKLRKETRIYAVKQLKSNMKTAAWLCNIKVRQLNLPSDAKVVEDKDLSGKIRLVNGYPASLVDLTNTMTQEGYEITGKTLHLKGRAECGVIYKSANKIGETPEFIPVFTGC